MGAESSKTCQQSHSFIQANYWTDYRCRIPVKADSKDKDVDYHTVTHLEGQSPQKQIPPLHTIITSRYITRAQRSQCTLQCGTLVMYMGRNCGMRKVPLQVAMGTKIPLANYCMCAYVLCMSLCVQACVTSNSLIPCCCLLGHLTDTKRGGLYIAQSMTPGWRVLRSTLKPCTKEEKFDLDWCLRKSKIWSDNL